MKPLLIAPLTTEDFAIKLRLRITYFTNDVPALHNQRILEARRDAELMYQRTLCTAWGGVKGGRLVIGTDRPYRRKPQA